MQISIKIGSALFIITIHDSFCNPCVSDDIERHNHIDYEFIYMAEGSCSIEVNSTKQSIDAGYYYLIKPGVYHSQKAVGASEAKKISFSLEYQKNYFKEVFLPNQEDEMISKALCHKEFLVEKDNGEMKRLIQEIQSELMHHQFGYYAKLQALFALLIILLLRVESKNKIVLYDMPINTEDDRNSIIEHFFEKNYNHTASLSQLSDLLHISTRQLNRVLKDKYNMSFKQKMIEIRIETAKLLLETTDEPINVICEKVGYESTNFSAMFKRKTGFSPKEYKQKFIKDAIKF